MTPSSDLSCKIRSRKGVNVQSTGSRLSQPVDPSGSGSICSNPAMDELPLITRIGADRESQQTWSCFGLLSEEESRELQVIQPLVRQQKQLMTMDASFDWAHLCPASSCPPHHNLSILFPPSLVFSVLFFFLTCQYPLNFPPDCKRTDSDVSTVA